MASPRRLSHRRMMPEPMHLAEKSRPAPSSAPPHAVATGSHADARPAIAVFTNCYPKTSHSFIRNEILALERQGFDVLRITVRPTTEALVDPGDVTEASRTSALLARGGALLAPALLSNMIRHPRRFLAALRTAISESGRSAGLLRSLIYFAEACRLADILRDADIRHFHVHFGTNPAAVARLTKRLCGASYSLTVHGPDEFDAPVPLMLAEKIADAAFVVGVSSFGRSQLMRWSSPAHWPRIAVVRCGVAHSFASAADDDAAPAQSNTLVCVARLSAQKGIALLIEAAGILAQTDDFTLRIVGDGELRESIAAQIAASGLESHVVLAGLLDSHGVRRELAQARAMVLPSFAEGLPVVLMEAMALRRPVIATMIAGIPELVDARCGWLVPAGSAPALADAMRKALRADPETVIAMGKNGWRRVTQDHDIDRNAALLAGLLRDAIADLPAQPPR